MRKLRIALITANYNHMPDGVSLTLNKLVSYLLNHGHEVLVFAPSIPDAPVKHTGEIAVNNATFRIPGRKEYLFVYAFPDYLKERLTRYDPDLVHIATPDFAGSQALLHSLRINKPVVSSYHTHFISYFSYYGIGRFESCGWAYQRWFYSNCIHTYVPTESMIEELRRNGHHNEMRIWARGIDLNRFNPNRRNLDWRRSLGFSDQDIIVTMVSRLVWEKEMRTLIEIFKGLNHPDCLIRTLVVGEGPARSFMESELPDTVFTGHLKGDELAVAFASSDVFVFPSFSETFGNVTLEALASGVPAVVTDAPGNRSLVQHKVNGFLVGRRDVQTFRNRILEIAGNEQLRTSFSANASTFAKNFAWNEIFSKLVTDYHEALATFESQK
jgi:phosphatidylinositol alpha 1,6-mannosyltransferase